MSSSLAESALRALEEGDAAAFRRAEADYPGGLPPLLEDAAAVDAARRRQQGRKMSLGAVRGALEDRIRRHIPVGRTPLDGWQDIQTRVAGLRRATPAAGLDSIGM